MFGAIENFRVLSFSVHKASQSKRSATPPNGLIYRVLDGSHSYKVLIGPMQLLPFGLPVRVEHGPHAGEILAEILMHLQGNSKLQN